MRRLVFTLVAALAGAALGGIDLNGSWELEYFPQPSVAGALGRQ